MPGLGGERSGILPASMTPTRFLSTPSSRSTPGYSAWSGRWQRYWNYLRIYSDGSNDGTEQHHKQHGSPGSAGEPERPHPPGGLRQLQEPGDALVDRKGQHRPAL